MKPAALRGCFVTGTDTGIGKTTFCAGLLHALATTGRRVAGYKPVAAGAVRQGERWINEDVEALRLASRPPLSAQEVCACLLREACAPHIAARLEARSLQREALLQGAQALAARVDTLVVEGVGGFCVPLGDGWGSDDLAADLGLPVVLVVGLRLGCISHALLTAQAVAARGLRLAGWAGNVLDPAMAHLQENIETLRRELSRSHGAPCLGTLPWLAPPAPAAVAMHLDLAPLLLAMERPAQGLAPIEPRA